MIGMKLNLLLKRSIKFRVTLFTLGIFMVSLWALSWYTSHVLRQDMQRLLGEQQFSAVTMVAGEINEELHDRWTALEKTAQQIDNQLMATPAALQSLLEQRPILQTLFNGGIFVTDTHGTAIADIPLSAGRIGTNYMDRESVSVPLKQGQTVIGRPAMGKKLGAPIFSIVAPIFDVNGRVIGALVGTVNLGLPSFLDKITQGRYGQSGVYLLNAPQYRLIVTSTDPSRIMQPLPNPGINTMLDRFVQGHEGYGVSFNARGVEQITAAKGIPIAGWFMGLTVPTSEAFAPIEAMQRRFLLATIVLTLLAGTLTWWMLRHELAPLVSTAKALAVLADTGQPFEALHNPRQDEIGELVVGFNRLLASLGQREAALSESEIFKASILNALSSHIAVLDRHGVITAVNDAWCSFSLENSAKSGQPAPSTGVGVNYLEMCRCSNDPVPEGAQEAYRGILQVLQRKIPFFSLEYPCHSSNERRWFMLTATPMGGTDQGVVIAHTDITKRKYVEFELLRYRDHLEELVTQQTSKLQQSMAALSESEELFRLLAQNTNDGLAVLENNVIIYASPTYWQILGYQERQELKRDEGAISASVHPDDVDRVLSSVEAAIRGGLAKTIYTYRVRHQNGYYIWREDSTRFTYRDDGSLYRCYVVARDVSGRVETEARLKKTTELLRQTGQVAKIGGWELDLKTMMVDWSEQIFRIVEREPTGPQTVDQVISCYVPDSQSKIRAALAQALEQGLDWNLELEAATDQGHLRWIQTLGHVERDGEQIVRVFGSARDVTAEVLHRRADEEQQQMLQLCFDNLQTGVAVFSETALLYCNQAFRFLLAYANDAPLEHLTMQSLVPSVDQHYLQARHKRAKAYRETLPPKLMKLSGNGGAVVNCLLSGSIIPWGGASQFLASITPIGDSDKIKQEMLASEERFERLLVAQLESQQAAIARELHDSLGSRLAGVAMLLGGLGQRHPELAVEINMALDQIQTVAEVSRTLARGLMPVDTSAGAFWRSLERLCLDYQQLAGVQCTFSMDGDFEGIDAEVGNHLFRIAQEALVNAVKHGHASTIQVVLEEHEDSFLMSVVDNGSQGSPFGVGAHSSGGLGLKSMQARAKSIGALFRWYINDVGGVTVTIVWHHPA